MNKDKSKKYQIRKRVVHKDKVNTAGHFKKGPILLSN